MKKLVKEELKNILHPKSEDAIQDSIDERVEKLQGMEIREVIQEIYDQMTSFRHMGGYDVGRLTIATKILMNVEIKERNDAIKIVFKDYMEQILKNENS